MHSATRRRAAPGERDRAAWLALTIQIAAERCPRRLCTVQVAGGLTRGDAEEEGSLSIYDGFEGYRDPNEAEVLGLLSGSPVILDTNVLLDIYGFEEPARLLALDVLEAVGDSLWVPHQVMREFWRNRQSVIAGITPPVQPVEVLRTELFAVVNSLRPDQTRTTEVQSLRETLEEKLSELSRAMETARGEPLDVNRILHDTSLDPILSRLEVMLDGRVGLPFSEAEETELVLAGLRRFEARVPPGYEDGEDKAGQLPERGTGDFLVWEQTLRHVLELDGTDAFILVTNDLKDDWRVVLRHGKKRVLGARPELIEESLRRTGARLVLLSQSDFYRLMAKLGSSDAEASESLVSASTPAPAGDATDAVDRWTYRAYQRLLTDLVELGSDVQRQVILLAARAGGFISRAAIYEHAGFDQDRSLRRFSFPAQRLTQSLIDEGVLRPGVALPLEALYEGPGKTIGYQVPPEFVEFESARSGPDSLTWLQAAAAAAASAPERTWSVGELVGEVLDRGLKDASAAKTPVATLRRDLSFRDSDLFEAVDGGYRLMTALADGPIDGAE